jgi:hypothetical protein
MNVSGSRYQRRSFIAFYFYVLSLEYAQALSSGFIELSLVQAFSTPNCLAYSACSRCQPANFIASGPTMRPIGVPLSR